MFDKVSILMAYQPDHGPRDVIFRWVKQFYQNTMPHVEICIGQPTYPLFNRAQGLNLAAKQATRDIFVIADGDVLFAPATILEAIQLLKHHAWVVPFHNRKIINLSKQNTEELLRSEPKLPLQVKLREYDIESQIPFFAGKLNVITRKNFNRVGGFDERFIGYGREDDAFALAVNTLCGFMKRMDRMVFHLWHPHGGAISKRNENLRRLYLEAYGDPQKMYQLIQARKMR